LSVYDVYGFVVAVEGLADKVFSEQYGHFKISKVPQKIDLFVKVNEAQRCLPTKPYGCLEGIYIPFDEDKKILWYDEGIELVGARSVRLRGFCQFLMLWPDKTLLHAGGVAKKGKAYIFTGGGGTGKTSVVLNLLKEGYSYLSDDWLVIGGGKAFPLFKRIHIFDYNLKDKEVAKRVLGFKRLYYKPMLKLLEYGSKLSPHRYIQFIIDHLRERTMFSVELCKIYPESRVAPPSPVSKVFLLERRKVDCIEIKKNITPKKLARKMAYVTLYEWNFAFREYYRYVYLFEAENQRIENRFYHDLKIMSETFRKAELYRVIVPEGLDLTEVKLTSMLNID
jgi:hypothetical protein